MIEAPLALAFGAGLVATVNPCGFAMLPAYLSYFAGLGGDEGSRRGAVARALLVGTVMSAAFLAVFGTAGVVITAGFRSVIDWIPWLALVAGAAVGALGLAMLLGFEPTVSLPKAGGTGRRRGWRAVFAFGASYAVASLSCTLPVFLSVVATQLTTADLLSGVATFLAYGAGMSLLLVAVTLALALGRHGLVGRLRASARYVNRVAGAILVVAGGYIVWFWATNLASGAQALGGSGAFRFVERLSQQALAIVAGNVAAWGVGLGAVVSAAIVYVLLRPPAGEPEDPAPPPPTRVSSGRA